MDTIQPSLAAGLLLAANEVLRRHGLAAPTAKEVLAATGATRTTAYKLKAAVIAALPGLIKPSGRPQAPPITVDTDTQLALTMRVRDYLLDHPGCVSGSATRRTFTAPFRLFVLQLCEDAQLPFEAVAEATAVKLGTLKDWMRGELPQISPEQPTLQPGPGVAQIETVLAAFAQWRGAFLPFCQHVQLNLRIPFGRQHISDLLEAHGARIPKHRKRAVDASAMRGQFETFFPNAQWVGDGTELEIDLAGRRFKVNLELLVDVATGAFTGASVRSSEDAAAVTEAFHDGKQTIGESPIALLLDNKPSNHCPAVDDVLDDTLRMRSRPYEPTDKPHVEGAFGLFKQEAPALMVSSMAPERLAAELARLVVTTWLRAVNHRPRADRGGKSRVELFRDVAPTEAEKEQARAALRERQRRQDLARQTRARRQDPVVRALLDAAFARLMLEDPESHLRTAIASWPLDAVVDGVAIFEGKKAAGTLPEGVDGRYLRGIVKNIAQEREGMEIMEALLRARLAARDMMLVHLGRQKAQADVEADDVEDIIHCYVAKAMGSRRGIDRTFWLLATADAINKTTLTKHQQLTRLAARRIHATYAVMHAERLAATRLLLAKVVPLS